MACVVAHGGAGYTLWKGTVLADRVPKRTDSLWDKGDTKGIGRWLHRFSAEDNLAQTHETGTFSPGEELGESRCGVAHHALCFPILKLEGT